MNGIAPLPAHSRRSHSELLRIIRTEIHRLARPEYTRREIAETDPNVVRHPNKKAQIGMIRAFLAKFTPVNAEAFPRFHLRVTTVFEVLAPAVPFTVIL